MTENDYGVNMEKNLIYFSIIMPTYNRSFCIEKAINSLLNQTYKNFELIIIDDGSTDNTKELIEEKYPNELLDKRIVYKKLDKNQGVCKARNIGLKLARYDWIGYLDSDNEMLPDFLETFKNTISENLDDKIFYSKLYGSDGLIVGKPFDYNSLLKDNFIDIGVFIHHKSLIKRYGNFDTTLKRLVDWDLILRYTKNEKPVFIDKALLKYSSENNYARISNSESYKIARKKISYKQQNFTSKIFSIKNTFDRKHKIVTILGIKLKIKRKKADILLHINKNKLTKEIQKNTGYGLSDQDRNPQLIVSLTSFPQRMNDIHYCLHSLLCQTLKPNKLILWLAEEQFPNKEKDLPQKVLELKQRGLSIEWCKDTKSYKKLIPALKKYPDDIIVTADDDIYYPNDWLEKLYNAYLNDNKSIHSHRVHKITFDFNKNINPYNNWEQCIKYQDKSFLNFSTGAGGTLYPPHSLYKDILDETLFLKLAPNADDIWFWAMAVLNGTQTHIVQNNMEELVYINPERELGLTNEITLFKKNGINGENDIQIRNLIKYYPQIMEKLLNE